EPQPGLARRAPVPELSGARHARLLRLSLARADARRDALALVGAAQQALRVVFLPRVLLPGAEGERAAIARRPGRLHAGAGGPHGAPARRAALCVGADRLFRDPAAGVSALPRRRRDDVLLQVLRSPGPRPARVRGHPRDAPVVRGRDVARPAQALVLRAPV